MSKLASMKNTIETPAVDKATFLQFFIIFIKIFSISPYINPALFDVALLSKPYIAMAFFNYFQYE